MHNRMPQVRIWWQATKWVVGNHNGGSGEPQSAKKNMSSILTIPYGPFGVDSIAKSVVTSLASCIAYSWVKYTFCSSIHTSHSLKTCIATYMYEVMRYCDCKLNYFSIYIPLVLKIIYHCKKCSVQSTPISEHTMSVISHQLCSSV